jgi:DNA-binding NarL/FixJ family response regulator
MPKRRPSNAISRPVTVPLDASSLESAAHWGQRVFKNTYTRRGHRIEVKRWSVKIQHQGIRRTVSLAAGNHADAVIEAQALYQTILTLGWESVLPALRANAEADSWSKADVRYWKRRLLRRRHPSSPHSKADAAFSARIEHAGVSHYFPLATLNEDAAAARARGIYLVIVKDGWAAATRRFSRELTIALHWAENPLAWTYATFHTELENSGACAAAEKKRRLKIIIVEPEAGVRRALSRCVNSQAGFVCAGGYANTEDAVRGIVRSAPHLALVNRSVFQNAAGESRDKLHRAAPDLPALFFTVYEDSDQLFKATPGGASGYLLKRTSPERLFDPVAGAVTDKTLSPEGMAGYVRHYFQNMVHSLSTGDPARDVPKLTHREHEILSLLSKGYVDKEIAETLGISGWTVHGHLKKVFEKLGVHTRTEAAVKYLHK